MTSGWAALSTPPAELLGRYWHKAPLVQRHGPRALEALGRAPVSDDPIPFFEDVRALVASGKGIVYASLPHSRWLAGSSPERPYFSVPVDAIERIVGAGYSVQINGLEHLLGRFEGIARAGRGLAGEIGHAGALGIGLTISPPGAEFDPHLDPAGALIVQTSGRKRYRFGRAPLVEHPRAKGFIVAGGRVRYEDEPDDEPVYDARDSDEAILGPGDSLYLPAGCVHETKAVETSWALLFMFMEVGVAEIASDLIARAFEDDPAFRHVPPLGECRSALPNEAREFAVTRLRQAAARIEAASDLEVASMLLGRVARHASAAHVASPTPFEDDAMIALDPDPALRWITGDDVTRVFAGSDELELAGDWTPFMHAMDGAALRVRDALTRAPDPTTAREVIHTLVDHGVLRLLTR